MPTNAETIEIAKASQYLVADYNAKGALFGRRLSPDLAAILYMERKGIEWAYNQNNNYADITWASNYLFSICQFQGRAQVIINGGGGGTPVTPVIPTPPAASIYPFIITSSDFKPNGISYDNSNIVGDTLSIFVNEFSQQWLVAGPLTFSYSLTGIIINIPGFDSNTQTWTIMIQKLNS